MWWGAVRISTIYIWINAVAGCTYFDDLHRVTDVVVSYSYFDDLHPGPPWW